MKRILSALTLSAVLASPAWSEIVTIKCKWSDQLSEYSFNLSLNFEDKTALFEHDKEYIQPSVVDIQIHDDHIFGSTHHPESQSYTMWILLRDSLQLIGVALNPATWSKNNPANILIRGQCTRGI